MRHNGLVALPGFVASTSCHLLSGNDAAMAKALCGRAAMCAAVWKQPRCQIGHGRTLMSCLRIFARLWMVHGSQCIVAALLGLPTAPAAVMNVALRVLRPGRGGETATNPKDAAGAAMVA